MSTKIVIFIVMVDLKIKFDSRLYWNASLVLILKSIRNFDNKKIFAGELSLILRVQYDCKILNSNPQYIFITCNYSNCFINL